MKKLLSTALSVSAFIGSDAQSGTPQDHLGFVERYAKDYGISQHEARQRLRWTDRAIEAQTALRKLTPATFSGLHIEQTPKFKVVAKFTASPSATIRRLLHAAPFQIESALYSEQELLSAMEAVVEDLGSRGIRHSAGVDVRSSKVIVSVDPADAPKIGAAYAKGLNSIYEWRNEFKSTEPTFAPYAAYNGGDRLWGASGQFCTSGFHAKTASGTPVITTSGHCDDDMRLWNSNGTRIPRIAEVNKGSLDIQWHSYTSSVYYLFPAIDAGSYTHDIRGIRTKSQMAVGQHVCKWGHKTYLTCGDILKLDHVESYNGENGNYIIVHHQHGDMMNDQGDSGGPVFAWHEGIGYTAYGSVHGRGGQATPYRNDLFFMPTDGYAAAGLTIMVRTD